MARFIGYEGARRYADYIEKLTGDQEIVPPGYIIEDDPPENWYLKRVRPWSSAASVAANPANFGRMQLTNPVGSEFIVVVQGMGQFNKPTAGGIDIRGDAAATGGGVSPANGLDGRILIDNTGVLAVSPPQNTIGNANAVRSGYVIDFVAGGIGADTFSRVLPVRPFILTPGHNVTVYDVVANEAATFVAWGYTRPARREELAL